MLGFDDVLIGILTLIVIVMVIVFGDILITEIRKDKKK